MMLKKFADGTGCRIDTINSTPETIVFAMVGHNGVQGNWQKLPFQEFVEFVKATSELAAVHYASICHNPELLELGFVEE